MQPASPVERTAASIDTVAMFFMLASVAWVKAHDLVTA